VRGVHFDAERFQQWYTTRTDDGVDLDGVSDLIADAASDPASGWTLAPGVSAIDFWHIPDMEGLDGGGFVSVSLFNGLSLRARYSSSQRWLADLAEGGAGTVLARIADEVNLVVDKMLTFLGSATPGPAGAQETDREVIVYVRSEEQLRDLERAIGVRVYELGWRGQHTLDLGARLDRQYRLDAAVQFAQATGLRYREVVETTVEHPALVRR
jgi:hypothetical protein